MVTLDGDVDHTSALHHAQEVAVADGGAAPVRLFEDLEEHHHHKTDDEPQRQVLIKRVQFAIASISFSQRLTNLKRQGECGSVDNSVHPGDMSGKKRKKIPLDFQAGATGLTQLLIIIAFWKNSIKICFASFRAPHTSPFFC
jgi:hypothetical protein